MTRIVNTRALDRCRRCGQTVRMILERDDVERIPFCGFCRESLRLDGDACERARVAIREALAMR